MWRRRQKGNIFPTQSELHSPNVTARHAKELTLYLGGQLFGIANIGKQTPEIARGYPYAIVTGVRAAYDPYTAAGFGGQTAVQAGQFVTFIVASWIRELGYRATMKIEVPREQRERLAVAAAGYVEPRRTPGGGKARHADPRRGHHLHRSAARGGRVAGGAHGDIRDHRPVHQGRGVR